MGMNRRIIIATHGTFAEGIKASLKIIYGDVSEIECICAYVEPSIDYQKVFRDAVARNDYATTELVVVTDVLGGSVNNEFMELLGEYPFHLVTGLNLGLLLGIVCAPVGQTPDQIRETVNEAGKTLVYCNDLIDESEQIESEDFWEEVKA